MSPATQAANILFWSASPRIPAGNLNIGGGRPLSTLMPTHGVNNTDVSLGRTMTSFSHKALQESTVLTSAFSAEYGQSGGGVINVTTKSGTNALSGTLLWYNRNPAFAAAPLTLAAANRPVATLKYNQLPAPSASGSVRIPEDLQR